MRTDDPDAEEAAAAGRSFWRRLPRVFYWTVGGVIACGGAVVARTIGDHLHPDNRYLAWLAGCALIFIGIAVLSLGTHDKADKLIWSLLASGGWSG